ncbi:hypothetical protein KIPB_001881 [Kipferlia bialata]|uniref:SAP domain-containing protein n=1 Tax=Kipferlia bialata TaxID=797122 RepID=A0A9K3CR88_9EUKA|nr:hypothetical protein KIPB_001881 [Kipferlia bialata]|eukprot:g1881.t1
MGIHPCVTACEHTSPYAHEARTVPMTARMVDEGRFPQYESGPSVADIKATLKSKGLCSTGNRFDLVLRVVQSATGKGTPKQAKGTWTEDGEFVPKKRGPSMVLPNKDKLVARLQKLAYPGIDAIRKMSNTKSKYHLDRCVQLVIDQIQTHIITKDLFNRDRVELAWDIITSLNQIWVGSVGYTNSIRGWGYVDVNGTLSRWITQMEQLCTDMDEYLDKHRDKQTWWEENIVPVLDRHFEVIQSEVVQFGMDDVSQRVKEKLIGHLVMGEIDESAESEQGASADEEREREGEGQGYAQFADQLGVINALLHREWERQGEGEVYAGVQRVSERDGEGYTTGAEENLAQINGVLEGRGYTIHKEG